MKRIFLFFKGRGMSLPFMLLAILTFSCSSDDNKDDLSQTTFENEFFTVINGEFSNKNLPAATAGDLDIISLSGNNTILAGGSNPITVVTPENATGIVVGVQGHKGYFTVPVGAQSRNTNSTTTYSTGISSNLNLLIGYNVTEDFVISFAAQNRNGDIGDYYQLEVNYLEAGTGKLHVHLSWNQENDVDLHLIEPNGEKIYYGNSYSENGGELDIDSNPACFIDGVKNENIYYKDNAETIVEYGEYEVLVDLYSACDITEPTDYIVKVFYGGTQIATTEGQNPYFGVLMPEDESGNSDLISVMKFKIQGEPAPRSQGGKVEAPPVFQFKFKDQDKLEKPQTLSPQKM